MLLDGDDILETLHAFIETYILETCWRHVGDVLVGDMLLIGD